MDNGVINLVSDDEPEEEDVFIRRPQKRPRVTTTPPPSSLQSPKPGPSDDDLIVVSHTKRGTATKRGESHLRRLEAPATEGGEGVECVGERRGIQALADYPHFRFQCALEQFKRARAFKKERFCPRCFCYVCDVPAAQCKTWMNHAKAVDTVPKWRAEREARLEERRRKEQCDTADRGTVVSRISAPVRVRRTADDNSSFENGNSSDALDGGGERCSGDEAEDINLRCDFDRTIRKLDQVSIEADCFDMVSLQRELDAESVRRGSRMRRRQLDMAELID